MKPIFQRALAALLCACANCAIATPSPPDIAPTASTIVAMQGFAVTLDDVLQDVVPALATPFGAQSRIVPERWLARLNTVLTAYAVADLHWQRSQTAARESGDTESLVVALVARTELKLLLGDYDDSKDLARELSQIAERNDSDIARAYSHEFLGILTRRQGNIDGAAEHQEHALELWRKLGDAAGASRALAHLGTICRDRGDFAHALDYQLQSLAEGKNTSDRIELTYRNLALLYSEIDDAGSSNRYHLDALNATRRSIYPSYYLSVMGSYARFLNDHSHYEQVLPGAATALALARALHDKVATAWIQIENGRALVGLKRYDEASADLNSALTIGRELKQNEIIARSLLSLTEIAIANADYQAALAFLDEALRNLSSSRMKPQLAHAYTLREQVAAAQGDTASALRDMHLYDVLHDELMGARASRQLAALEAERTRADVEQKRTIAARDQQLEAARLQSQGLVRRLGLAVIAGLSLLVALIMWRFLGTRKLNRKLAGSNQEIEQQRIALSNANRQLEAQAGELQRAAATDTLTGIFNRGHTLKLLAERAEVCLRNGRPLGLLMIDFDHFKHVNDNCGHLFGDRILVAGVQAIRACLEPDDVLGRYGGEEFLVIVRDRNLPDVHAFAERVRNHVARELAELAPRELNSAMTISIGIGMLAQSVQPAQIETLVGASDRAVYAAKAAGRNRVSVDSESFVCEEALAAVMQNG